MCSVDQQHFYKYQTKTQKFVENVLMTEVVAKQKMVSNLACSTAFWLRQNGEAILDRIAEFH